VPQNKQKAHKVLNYKKAQWDQIEKDLTETYKQLKKDIFGFLCKNKDFWVYF
jgi:hypothetical protein